jgi:hypothetical protein
MISSWEIIVDEIVGIDFGKFDYGDEKINMITMELKIVDCILR